MGVVTVTLGINDSIRLRQIYEDLTYAGMKDLPSLDTFLLNIMNQIDVNSKVESIVSLIAAKESDGTPCNPAVERILMRSEFLSIIRGLLNCRRVIGNGHVRLVDTGTRFQFNLV